MLTCNLHVNNSRLFSKTKNVLKMRLKMHLTNKRKILTVSSSQQIRKSQKLRQVAKKCSAAILMKVFNVLATLGALAAMSEGIAIKERAEFDFSDLHSKIESLKTMNSHLMHRVSSDRQHEIGTRLEASAMMAMHSQEVGVQNWWGWWVSAVIDVVSDLV
jgi:hypothetical protein